MKQLLWGMRNFYLFNKNYLSKTYNVSCLPDVEYMVWKFLYTSCLKACTCLYSCVCFVHLFPTTGRSQVNCSHTYALPKPPSSRAIFPPLHNPITHKWGQTVALCRGPAGLVSPSPGFSTHCTTWPLQYRLAYNTAMRTSMERHHVGEDHDSKSQAHWDELKQVVNLAFFEIFNSTFFTYLYSSCIYGVRLDRGMQLFLM